MSLNNGLSFFEWIDDCLKESWPAQLCFNLYEGVEPYRWHVQLIGSNTYDEVGEWVCDEAKSTGENVFYFSEKEAGSDWQTGLSNIRDEVTRYLAEGNHSDLLKNSNVIAIGFVDGDLEILFAKM